jgi:hypothetical protein
MLLGLNLCLSDIPKEYIKVHENGKFYVSLLCAERQSEGKFGETHLLKVGKTKAQAEVDNETHYCGSGKILKENVEKSVSDMPERDLPDWLRGNTNHEQNNESQKVPF